MICFMCSPRRDVTLFYELHDNVTLSTGCLKTSFKMEFQILLWGEYYENAYTLRRTKYPSFSVLNNVKLLFKTPCITSVEATLNRNYPR
jgi:hypothetical protein